MVRALRFLNLSLNDINSIAVILAASTLLTYLISFLRDRLFAQFIGATNTLDLYLASFRIADVLFIFVTSMLSLYVLLPAFQEKINSSKEELKELVDTIFYILLTLLIIVSVVAFFAIPFIASLLFDSFSFAEQENLILFSRIFLVQFILLSLSSFAAALTQLRGKFLIFALSPVFYNLSIVVGVLFLYPKIGILGVVFSVLVGALLHLGIQIPFIIKDGIFPRIRPIETKLKEVFLLMKISLPRALSLSSKNLSKLIIAGLLIGVQGGAFTMVVFAESLRIIPFAVIALSYSIAAFPLLSKHFLNKDMEKFNSTVTSAFNNVFLFVFPVMIFMFVFRENITSFIFEVGKFGANEVYITSAILGVLIWSTFGSISFAIGSRTFYAAKKTWIPFGFLITSSVLEVVSAVLVLKYFSNPNSELVIFLMGVLNISVIEVFILVSVAFSITIIEVVMGTTYLLVMYRYFKLPVLNLLKAFSQNVLASVGLGLSAYFLIRWLSEFYVLNNFFTLLIGGVAGCLVWIIILLLFKNNEFLLWMSKFSRIF